MGAKIPEQIDFCVVSIEISFVGIDTQKKFIYNTVHSHAVEKLGFGKVSKHDQVMQTCTYMQ